MKVLVYLKEIEMRIRYLTEVKVPLKFGGPGPSFGHNLRIVSLVFEVLFEKFLSGLLHPEI